MKEIVYNGNDIFRPFNAGLYGIDDDSERALDFDATKESIVNGFESEYGDAIRAALEAAGMKLIRFQWYSPREYNFANDSVDMVIEVMDADKLKAAMIEREADITAALLANKSHDGYVALTPDNFAEAIDRAMRRGPDACTMRVLLSGIPFHADDLWEWLEWIYPCEKCGEFHDVEAAGGHDLIQAQRVMECERSQFPDDEAFKEPEPENGGCIFDHDHGDRSRCEYHD